MENVNTNPQAAPKNGKKPGLILGTAVPVVIIAIVCGIFAAISIHKSDQYEAAMDHLDDGDFREAVTIHQELGEYRDLKIQIEDHAMEEVEDLLDDGDYADALEVLEAVAGYVDAAADITRQINDLAEGCLEARDYQTVVALYELAERNEPICNSIAALMAGDVAANLNNGEDGRFEDLYNLLAEKEIRIDAVDAAVFEKGCQELEAGAYENAIYYLNKVAHYEGAAEKIAEAEEIIYVAQVQDLLVRGRYSEAMELIEASEGALKEKLLEEYTQYCGDRTFIEDLEQAMNARDKVGQKANFTYDELIDAEWDYLSKYREVPFLDPRLQELAQAYLDALTAQGDTLLFEGDEFYYRWNLAAADRYEVLEQLLNEYAFAKDDAALQEKFVGVADTVRRWFSAWWEITQDLDDQLRGVRPRTNENGEYYLAYTNRTAYTFSVTVVHSFEEYNAAVGEMEGEYMSVAPGQDVQVFVVFPEAEYSYWYVHWEIYDIMDGDTLLS